MRRPQIAGSRETVVAIKGNDLYKGIPPPDPFYRSICGTIIYQHDLKILAGLHREGRQATGQILLPVPVGNDYGSANT